MDDPYITRLLDTAARDLWEIAQPIHFAILPLDKKMLVSPENQEAAFLRYGLQAVYFDNLNETFTGLDKLLEEALEIMPVDRAIAPKSIQRAATIHTSDVGGATSDKLPTQQVRANVAVSQAWLEEVNEVSVAILRKNED